MENHSAYVSPAVVECEERMRRADQRILAAVSAIAGSRAGREVVSFGITALMAPRPSAQTLVWD